MQVWDGLMQLFDLLEGSYLQQKDTLMLHKRFFYMCGGGWKIKVYSAQMS